MSFRMTSFAAAQRMTTAESPEPLAFSAFRTQFFKQILQQIDGPAARHFVCFVYFVCFVLRFVCIRVHSWFLFI